MKKKDFKQKLQLGKRVISTFSSTQLKGGVNSVTMADLTTLVTTPKVCETKGDVCTAYCETKEFCN